MVFLLLDDDDKDGVFFWVLFFFVLGRYPHDGFGISIDSVFLGRSGLGLATSQLLRGNLGSDWLVGLLDSCGSTTTTLEY